tara:strand:+ start:132 stop:671 length:540 start_codon:yes stop_codon:yes gene_type:complete
MERRTRVIFGWISAFIFIFLGIVIVGSFIKQWSAKLEAARIARQAAIDDTTKTCNAFADKISEGADGEFVVTNKTTPKDAWGNQVAVTYSKDRKNLAVVSLGADATLGTEDDIKVTREAPTSLKKMAIDGVKGLFTGDDEEEPVVEPEPKEEPKVESPGIVDKFKGFFKKAPDNGENKD